MLLKKKLGAVFDTTHFRSYFLRPPPPPLGWSLVKQAHKRGPTFQGCHLTACKSCITPGGALQAVPKCFLQEEKKIWYEHLDILLYTECIACSYQDVIMNDYFSKHNIAAKIVIKPHICIMKRRKYSVFSKFKWVKLNITPSQPCL